MPTMASGSRRRSRIAAFQVLFEADVSGRLVPEVMERQLSESTLSNEARDFARGLVYGVGRHLEDIDGTIRQYASAFPLEDMSAVDRNVLRLAIYEVLFDTGRAPLRVAINEAVEIAKGYGSESSGRFINGVLGAVALEAAQRHESAPEDNHDSVEDLDAPESSESEPGESGPPTSAV
jgi:N utilization substance protein B